MNYLMYQSHALIDDDPEAHDAILRGCFARNASANLTGFLYREGQTFLQYLEGPPQELEHAMSRIRKDTRHEDIQIIGKGEVSKRFFPDWQMGFVARDMALSDYLDRDENGWRFDIEDPFDLIVFLSAHSELIREKAAA